MKRIFKDLYTQFLLITAGVLFGNGIVLLIDHLRGNTNNIIWYFPFEILFVGLVCTIPGILLYIEKIPSKIRILLHFILLLSSVILSCFIVGWFNTPIVIFEVLITFIFVYIGVWISMLFIYYKDEKEINDKLKNNQDND